MTAEYEVKLREEFLAFIAPGPDSRVIEFGCGPGNFLALLSPCCRSVTGVDRSRRMLRRARRRIEAVGLANVDLVNSPLETFSHPASFDIVVGSAFVYQFVDRVSVLNEMASFVRPGGTVATLDPSDRFTRERAREVARRRRLSLKERFVLQDWRRATCFYGAMAEATARQQFESAGLRITALEYRFDDLVLFVKAERN